MFSSPGKRIIRTDAISSLKLLKYPPGSHRYSRLIHTTWTCQLGGAEQEHELLGLHIDRPKAGHSTNIQEEDARALHADDLGIMDPNMECVANHGAAEPCEDIVSPLSGKPYFHTVMTISNIKPRYNMHIPVRMHSVLPSTLIPVILEYGEKSWKMDYFGDRIPKRFDKWKSFAIDNDLEAGDACVFELMECSSTNLRFKVQILRGDFPTDLLAKADGMTSKAPIVVD